MLLVLSGLDGVVRELMFILSHNTNLGEQGEARRRKIQRQACRERVCVYTVVTLKRYTFSFLLT